VFQFESKGIGKLLRQGRLEVPPNQRSYAWGETHIRNLLLDLNEAVTQGAKGDEYFLGTIVLIGRESEAPSIVDGQQRVATTTILLARIRDQLIAGNRESAGSYIEETFLSNIDIKLDTRVPRIKLNLEDHEFFKTQIVLKQDPDTMAKAAKERKKSSPQLRPSNRRLVRASNLAREFVSDIVKNLSLDAAAEQLIRWVEFIENNATVLVLTVPDDVSAFRMFETLNDRGLKASQADILKNYFFSKAGSRLPEAQMNWSELSNVVHALAGDDDEGEAPDRAGGRLVTYIRHLWITTHGPTKERELAAKIRGDINNEARTMQFLADGSQAAQDYAALWSGRHPKWGDYKPTTRQHIDTMAENLRVKQIRPLMFAVARHFEPDEADKAFRLFVSWSVRFLIFGGRGGMLDMQYSLRARDVGTKQITKARELRDAMKTYVPSDAEFEGAFAVARVSRAYQARYYLRALENASKQMAQPEYVPNESVVDINLEHVMPLSSGEDWEIDDDMAETTQNLLGNMVLLKSTQNRDLGNLPFAEKKLVYAKSGYDLTKRVAGYDQWTSDEIRDRQAKLAKLAVKTWALDLS
jgi:Protein of unknown function DUF262/Protein of unknown function (DUF1524)